MKKEKINTKDFNNCPIEKWNGTTFREYVKFLNVQKYGVPCVSNNVMIENSILKNFTKEYGNEVAKRFFEEGVRTHKGSDKYPTANIGFMISYMKASILPRVLKKEVQKTKIQQIREKVQEEQKNIESYF